MLLELHVRNVALIESLRLSLGPGLSTLTGETGAGKSIFIDAIGFVLGGRADRDMIRTGEDRAVVDAVFDISACEGSLKRIESMGIDAEDGLLSVTRELSSAGRSLCRVGGAVVPLSQLKEITAHLVDMHGQHEHQSLLSDARHGRFLDGFGSKELSKLKAVTADLYVAYREVVREMEADAGTPEERERQMDMLRFQIQEVSAAKLTRGEDEKLASRREYLKNAGKISSGLDEAWMLIYQGDGRQKSSMDALSRAADIMEGLQEYDAAFQTAAARAREAYYAAEDASELIRSLRSQNETFDPAEAERVENRLDEINKLKRKYGADIASVLAFMETAQEKLDALEGGEERQVKLANEKAKRFNALCAACGTLTEARKKTAFAFEKKVLDQLGDLGMPKARFTVEVRSPESGEVERALSPDGWDSVRFLLAVNPGEPLKPLSSTASGGEMSRIMLALKNIGAELDDVPTLIFDEIDTGISGRMAQVVGEKMSEIGKNRQVLCVTHSAQIAALGDNHYVVEKTIKGERTGTNVKRLDDAGRVLEIARLVGGSDDVTQSARDHAKEMLKASAKFKGETKP